MKIAIIGATGLVGNVMLKVLEERNFPLDKLLVVASERSIGKKITFKGKEIEVISISDALEEKPNIALFSAGGNTSLKWAPKFAEAGTTVIDNSSAWRMDPSKKLIVPEINASKLNSEDKIIANPNCSTIQMVMALAPLDKLYGINRIVVSTYQSVSGTGVKAVKQLEDEILGVEPDYAYPYQIHKNAIPHCDVFQENGYTKEEMKLVNETQKILDNPNIAVTATAVRIPTAGGHSESINVAFQNDFNLNDVISTLNKTEGVVVQDNVEQNIYPMPILAHNKDAVFVGRIRRDLSQKNTLNLWVVSDNLRKGAATNTIQIAEYLIAKNLV